jgi:hypothetical protein
MDKKTKARLNIADIGREIYNLLEPLDSEGRQKAINGALAMLGEAPTHGAPGGRAIGAAGRSDAADPTLIGLSPRGAAWIKQNGLNVAQIEQVFDISNQGVTVIASETPGKNKKEQSRNAYVLLGVSRLLASGDATFADKDARKVCEDLGCYDKANHAAYMNDKGNVLTGSKATGWKLTSPGLKHGADLVKELTKEG